MGHAPTDYEKLNKLMDYEEKSLPVRKIGIFVGTLMVGLLAVMGLMLVIFGYPQAKPRPDIVTTRSMLAPTLQHAPSRDLKKFKKQQAEHLSTYGWVNKAQGVVRIPIEAAMDLSIQRGMFPTSKEASK